MSPEEEALAGVIAQLRRFDIPFMITGSVAASYHGRPRATHDADLVIDPTPAQLDGFVRSLETAGYDVDPDSAARALRFRAQFNVIEKRIRVAREG